MAKDLRIVTIYDGDMAQSGGPTLVSKTVEWPYPKALLVWNVSANAGTDKTIFFTLNATELPTGLGIQYELYNVSSSALTGVRILIDTPDRYIEGQMALAGFGGQTATVSMTLTGKG